MLCITLLHNKLKIIGWSDKYEMLAWLEKGNKGKLALILSFNVKVVAVQKRFKRENPLNGLSEKKRNEQKKLQVANRRANLLISTHVKMASQYA